MQQDKLQALKAELAMRKTLKNKDKNQDQFSLKTQSQNSTGTAWTGLNRTTKRDEQVNKFLMGSTNSFNSTVSSDREKLDKLLISLKMEQFA